MLRVKCQANQFNTKSYFSYTESNTCSPSEPTRQLEMNHALALVENELIKNVQIFISTNFGCNKITVKWCMKNSSLLVPSFSVCLAAIVRLLPSAKVFMLDATQPATTAPTVHYTLAKSPSWLAYPIKCARFNVLNIKNGNKIGRTYVLTL